MQVLHPIGQIVQLDVAVRYVPATQLKQEDMFVGEPLPPPICTSDKRPRTVKMTEALLKGAASVATLGLGAIYFGVMASKKRRERRIEMDKNPFESFKCANCDKRQYYSKNALRYKCG